MVWIKYNRPFKNHQITRNVGYIEVGFNKFYTKMDLSRMHVYCATASKNRYSNVEN